MTASATNHLAGETSPYLLQHAHNPVDWYPWGPEALERARREDKPILLSVGYSACHWCHVMERECFENPAIAALMNAHFVCIKVDREERPDLDAVYMTATQALNHGQGGWPMTVFLTPSGEPFFAGTYFPPDDRWARPGFATVLQALANAWREQREALVEQAADLTAALRRFAQPAAAAPIAPGHIDAAVETLQTSFDEQYGGFGGAPKFPPCAALQLLLRRYRRGGDADLLRMATQTLDAMASGGIHDHIGGGFARYSTDARWLVPHFEKMLYDNAQLARVYLDAFVVTGEARHADVVRRTLDYLLREMTSPEGGFFSSTDADADGVEGAFYVWHPTDVEAALGAAAAQAFCAVYDITRAGNWEGKSIPRTPRPLAQVAAAVGWDADALASRLPEWRRQLLAVRNRRRKPGLDDKIITAWNGLAVGALAEAGRVLNEPHYVDAAARAARFVDAQLTDSAGRLLRTYRGGRAHLDAYLEDYAYYADGLILLAEATGDTSHMERAAGLAAIMADDFADPDSGGFFTTGRRHEALLVRELSGQDGATPSTNAVAASVLDRLGHYLDRPAWRRAAMAALQAHSEGVAQLPRAYTSLLAVLDDLLHGPVELVLVGQAGRDDFEALRSVVQHTYLPHRLLWVGSAEQAGAAASQLPLCAGKGEVQGRAALYVCRDFVCRAPVLDADAAEAALAALESHQRAV